MSFAVMLLLAVALVGGALHNRRALIEVSEARMHDRQQWLAQGERNPHVAAHFGRYAFRPVPSLTFFDPGIDDYTGVGVWLEAHYQDPLSYRAAEDENDVGQVGKLNAANILQILVPLLIFLLTFSSVSSEMERGTLRQMISTGVSGRTVAAGKILGTWFSFLVIFLPALVFGLASLFVSTRMHPLGVATAHAVWLACAYLLYFGILIALGVAVSALSSSSRTAFLLLLFLWVGWCFVIPHAATSVALLSHPALGYVDFWKQVNTDTSKGIDGHDPSDHRLAARRASLLVQIPSQSH